MLSTALIALLLAAAQPAGPAPRLSRDVVPVSSDSVTVDGVPMQIHRYRSQLAPEDVLALWGRPAADGPPPRSLTGGWQLASRLHGTRQETLQARAGAAGGSEVLLARVDLRAPLAAPAQLPFRLPAGSRILRTVVLADKEGRAHQFIVAMPETAPRAMTQLCARLVAGGWRPAGSLACDSANAPGVRWFLRGSETLAVALRAASTGSRAVIGHQVPRP